MNQQQQQQQQQQIKAPEPIAERQFCGYILALIELIFLTLATAGAIFRIFQQNDTAGIVTNSLEALSMLFGALFYYFIVSKPDYLKGKPGIGKMWPLILSSLVRLISWSIDNIISKLYYKIAMFAVIELLVLGVHYVLYFGDDEGGSCCLCFKPFIHKRPVVMYVPTNYGYPPQAYPPPVQSAQVHPAPPQKSAVV